MPNRILRAELLESEGWLALKDNADRAAYIACLLTVDTFGSMPAGPHRLVKLWRPYGIDTPEKAAKCFSDLIDVDLVRRYLADGKPYLHVPRFRQSRRFLGHIWPLSPWTTKEEKQRLAQKSPVDHSWSPVIHGDSPDGVGVGVGVGVGEIQQPVVLAALAPGPTTPRNPKPVNHGTRLPQDWSLPEDWEAWALEVRPDWSRPGVIRESITFRDFWLAKAGQNGVKMDWLATWRNWIRRCEKEPVR